MTSKHTPHCCPLCISENITPFFHDKKRDYLRCQNCNLVFVPSDYWLNEIEEKKIYNLHKNVATDLGYRKFLSRLSDPLLKKLLPKSSGLDFGCGPGPTLSAMLQEAGHRVELYDYFYYNDPELLTRRYDFISATEVVEHLNTPEREFEKLFTMLRRGGWLAIMTKLVKNLDAFSQWHYIRDMTHVCFYDQRTFEYIAHRFEAELCLVEKDVIFLKKL